jgi:hypothetical protein
MRLAATILIVAACLAAACSGDDGATPTGSPPAASPTPAPSAAASPGASPSAETPTASTATTPDTTATGFPPRCTALVANADVDALAAQHLRLTADGVSATSAGTSQLVCRFQGSGDGGDTAIIIVASGYTDPPTASAEDGILRTAAEGQGGKFTRLDGVADEAYSFTYPTVTGVIARNGSRSVSIGVGKLLGVPTPAEFNTLLQLLLAKLGQ